MYNRIKFTIEFIFDHQNKLFLSLAGILQNKPLNLSKAAFLLFLFKVEKELDSRDLEFCYEIAKYLRRVKLGSEVLDAIDHDYYMALFFKKCIYYEVDLSWQYQDSIQQVKFHPPLPLSVEVLQKQNSLLVKLKDRTVFLENPLAWMIFWLDNECFCFSKGVILQNPSSNIQKLGELFLEKDILIFDQLKAINFIEHTYEPNKKILDWQIKADLDFFKPKETCPVAVLTLTKNENDKLMLKLSYKYGDVYVDPNQPEQVITQVSKTIMRMKDMEAIYQKDLIDLFMEHKLPLMLESPGDVVKFLNIVVPILNDRGWKIISQVTDYVVLDKPAELNIRFSSCEDQEKGKQDRDFYNVQVNKASYGIDWFYFEHDCEVMGQKFSLTEIARLMVENQGYIKTNKGYVKISDESKQSLELLGKFGGVGTNKKFNRAEILPLVTAMSVNGNDENARKLKTSVNNIQRLEICEPGDDFVGSLRDYQKTGLNWLDFLHKNNFGGILADDMGLGKTVQTIAFASQMSGEGMILVVGPTNVIYNWEKEIEKFSPSKEILVYTGQNRGQSLRKSKKLDFLITSYGVLKNDIELLSAIKYKAIFVDEAQAIKNPNTQVSKAVKLLKSDFKLVMTGTPIENRIEDLWNLFDFVMPAYLGNKSHFDIQIKENCKDLIKTKITPFVLRRDKNEVLDSLPEKTEMILQCELSSTQKKIYETVLQAAKSGVKQAGVQKNKLNILTALMKLRQICLHPGLLKELDGNDYESHKFELVKEKILELMEEEHKVVVFTQFTKMLDILEKWLKEKKISIERIDGTITGKGRMNAIDRFQNADGAGVFLISLKAGGVGINLTAADYVIHLDPWWNPAVEAQATDRVHRMGQKNKVIVLKMITKGTIEEKIFELQEQKRKLITEIIDFDSGMDKQINFEEITQLLLSS
ncbi:DEAD/DEAH box helicase [bacterium]|nr:DEAD/DEAH box helicase [bacterium]